MNSNINKKINFSTLTGILSPQQLESIVDMEVRHYSPGSKVYSIFVLEFNILDSSHSSMIAQFANIIANTIYKNIKKGLDFYTIDNKGRFITFFEENGMNLAVFAISKIISEIKEKLAVYLELEIGIAEHPLDGARYKDLVASADRSILKARKRTQTQKSNSPADIPLKKLQGEIVQNNDPAELNKESLIKCVHSLINHINNYDSNLREHCALVASGSVILAKELELKWSEIERIAISALLHDIGYTLLPKNLFQNSGNLSQEDWKLVMLHPFIGCEQILRPLKIFEYYLPIIQNHHEFIDGSGYPKGKKADDIPIGSQIISIIDSYQSMRIDRVNRKALDLEDIVDIYIKNAGIKWDKDLITMFTAIIADPTMRDSLINSNEKDLGL